MTAPLSVKLRYFQKDAVDAEEKYLKENKTGNGVIVLPTAAGKSYTLAKIYRQLFELYKTKENFKFSIFFSF